MFGPQRPVSEVPATFSSTAVAAITQTASQRQIVTSDLIKAVWWRSKSSFVPTQERNRKRTSSVSDENNKRFMSNWCDFLAPFNYHQACNCVLTYVTLLLFQIGHRLSVFFWNAIVAWRDFFLMTGSDSRNRPKHHQLSFQMITCSQRKVERWPDSFDKPK